MRRETTNIISPRNNARLKKQPSRQEDTPIVRCLNDEGHIDDQHNQHNQTVQMENKNLKRKITELQNALDQKLLEEMHHKSKTLESYYETIIAKLSLKVQVMKL
jgi:hypothetical protein